MRKRLDAMVGVLALVGMVFAVAGGAAVARAAVPPHISKAYEVLMRTHYVLQHSCHRLGGHRERALGQVDAAINELRAAAAVSHSTLPPIPESGGLNVPAGSLHPYIQDALNQCHRAKQILATGAKDFGGHRVKAMQHLDAAIAQLQLANQQPACK